MELSLQEDANGQPVNDCRRCWSQRRQALHCPKIDPEDPEWRATRETLCPVPALERDPWTLAVLRAAAIEPGLSPADVCLWFWEGIETARAARGRQLKDRMIRSQQERGASG